MMGKAASDVLIIFFGFLLPAFDQFKQLNLNSNKTHQDYHKIIEYWIVASICRILEFLTDRILFWLPFYDEVKVCAWFWLTQQSGHALVYNLYIKPWLVNNELVIDGHLKRVMRIGGEFGAVQAGLLKQYASRLLFQAKLS